jgi:hypothetical protein
VAYPAPSERNKERTRNAMEFGSILSLPDLVNRKEDFLP